MIVAHATQLVRSNGLTGSAARRVWASQAIRKRVVTFPRSSTVRLRALSHPPPESDDRIKCFITAEGNLVCELLEPGNYRIETVEASEDTPVHCDVNNSRDCVTYCHILDDGTMVCEGLPKGEYAIKKAEESEIDSMLEHLQTLQETQSLEGGSEPGPVEKVISNIVGKARST